MKTTQAVHPSTLPPLILMVALQRVADTLDVQS
jgi:hypothetical protein